MKHLWVIEFHTDGPARPEPDTTPDFWNDKELRVIVADTHFVVVESTHDAARRAIQGYPYWRVAGHPADGRWIDAGGDHVCILDGEAVSEIELVEGLGMKPQDFDATSWDDADWDVVWGCVKAF